MYKIIFLFLLSIITSSTLADNSTLILPILEVHDGDTIKTELPLPQPLNSVSIRIRGIDSPEMPAESYHKTGKLDRAKCNKEALLALASKQAVLSLIDGTDIMYITSFEYDKYGGRIVADVKLKSGQDLATFLIDNGFAVKYDGGTKTKDWCK